MGSNRTAGAGSPSPAWCHITGHQICEGAVSSFLLLAGAGTHTVLGHFWYFLQREGKKGKSHTALSIALTFTRHCVLRRIPGRENQLFWCGLYFDIKKTHNKQISTLAVNTNFDTK